ncbi:MAG: hypothetical protein MUE45_00760 [Methanoregulaceae archaeon]|jgi:hypothetical protein|nr:hypothetical protein [Methanoregulaceae archaeon]MCU0628006.1 hypothetical protein [Methanoregulaceae archaeon]
MRGIPITLYLKKLRGGLQKVYIFLRNPYDTGDLESGIEQLERFHTVILRKDEPKPINSPPCLCEPILVDRGRCIPDSADSQLIKSIMATRLEIRELLVVENSEICPEETKYR